MIAKQNTIVPHLLKKDPLIAWPILCGTAALMQMTRRNVSLAIIASFVATGSK